ncbi:MAG: hypothetical protein ABW116_11815 [Candidatus Sedimenticola sp. 20ELBAFRAG]
MDDADFTDIFDHLRALVREAGFLYMDETASMESGTLPSTKHRLETYLYMTINMLKERSGSQAVNIYERFNRSLELEKGDSFGGVLVELSEAERDVYRLENYSLDEMDDLSPVIIELQKVLNEIKMEPEPPNNNFTQGPSL